MTGDGILGQVGAERSAERLIRSVTGDVAASALGVTACHEHLVLGVAYSGVADDTLTPDRVAGDLEAFRSLGGATIVELTNEGMGRDPLALRGISERTGLNIICSTGFYQQSHYPPIVGSSTEEELAEIFVRDLNDGIGDTGIRAGIIGEIGTSPGRMTTDEERVVRAAACASIATGAPISMHTPLGDQASEQVAILRSEGLDPGRVAIGHLDLRPDPDYHERIADMGVYIQYDTFGKSSYMADDARLACIAEMVRRGYGEQILLSCDISRSHYLRRFGGWGYAHLLDMVAPALRELVGDGPLRNMLVDNPARFLTFAP